MSTDPPGSASDDDGRDEEVAAYQVGYCRPPLHTRFPKGRSGNSKGRPRGGKNRKTIIQEVAYREVATKVGGKPICNIDLVIDAIRRAAAKGDPIAMRLVEKYAGQDGLAEGASPRAVMFLPEKLTDDEWMEKYGHLGSEET